jgi:hypothetical protein
MREAVIVRDALNAAWLITLTLWPLCAFAAADSIGATLGDVTLADWLSLIVLSTVSGLVALLQRIRASVEAAAHAAAGREARESDRIVIDWRLFAVAHMAGALFVGGVAFLLMGAAGISAHLAAACIALASWSGAKLADKWADAVGDRLSGVIGGSRP